MKDLFVCSSCPAAFTTNKSKFRHEKEEHGEREVNKKIKLELKEEDKDQKEIDDIMASLVDIVAKNEEPRVIDELQELRNEITDQDDVWKCWK